MLEHKDYLSSLNKARRKRNQKMDPRTLVLLMAAAAAIGIIIFGVIGIKNILSDRQGRRLSRRCSRPLLPRQSQ